MRNYRNGIELLGHSRSGNGLSFFHSEELKGMELRQVLIPRNGIGMEWRRPFRNTVQHEVALTYALANMPSAGVDGILADMWNDQYKG